jgi:hypothetical protein
LLLVRSGKEQVLFLIRHVVQQYRVVDEVE